MNKRRVVISGLGVVSAIGIGKDDFWKAALEGKCGISKVSSFDTKDFRCHYAGEIKNFHPEKYLPKRKISYLGRTSQMAITAAQFALKDARVALKTIDREQTGVFIGTTMGERPLEESIDIWVKEGLDKIQKKHLLQSTANNISNNIGSFFKLKGPNFLIPNACAAGNFAVGYAFDLIKSGHIDYALAGGADSFSKVAFSGFHRLFAMAPEKCQPFDKNRKGMMLGEGAGIMFIETLESALKREAPIYAEILGYGISCDAFHMTAPRPEGIEKAIRKALFDAGITPKDVDYINAHGTGTPANDKAECAALKKVFGTTMPPISSMKSMLGHTMGAASTIESIGTLLAIDNGMLPPTINYTTPDPECEIDCVANKARPAKINIAIKDGFAFGGNNACVVYKKLAD